MELKTDSLSSREAHLLMAQGEEVEFRKKHFDDYGPDYWTEWKKARSLYDLSGLNCMAVEYRKPQRTT